MTMDRIKDAYNLGFTIGIIMGFIVGVVGMLLFWPIFS